MDDLSDLMKNYFVPPRTLPGFPDARKAKPKTSMGGGKLRKRWKNNDDDILEWDYQHGKIERYDDKGHHKGEFDHETGDRTKPADPTRSVTPSIWKARKHRMQFHLAWYDKTSEELMGELRLSMATKENVLETFGLEPDGYPGDCLCVTDRQAAWVTRNTKLSLELDRFDYFIEATSE